MILRCRNFVTLFTVCNLKFDAPAATVGFNNRRRCDLFLSVCDLDLLAGFTTKAKTCQRYFEE